MSDERALAAFADSAELGKALTEMGADVVLVARLLTRYGAAACEGALFNTERRMDEEPKLRNPVGWLIKTLKRGLEWKPWEIKLYIEQREAKERAREEEEERECQRIRERGEAALRRMERRE